METFKVIGDPEDFFDFLRTEIGPRADIGVMSREDEIYLRTTDDWVLRKLGERFLLVSTEQPKNYFPTDSGWAYMGNAQLFDVKL